VNRGAGRHPVGATKLASLTRGLRTPWATGTRMYHMLTHRPRSGLTPGSARCQMTLRHFRYAGWPGDFRSERGHGQRGFLSRPRSLG
jgi:hypothetical protein